MTASTTSSTTIRWNSHGPRHWPAVGEPIARLPRETQHPVNPDFDDREFEDIPKELRDLDDKMTGGEMEYRELMVGVAMAVRVSVYLSALQ